MKHRLIIILALLPAIFAHGQGSLTPPGAPALTFKTLTQVEPRADVQTLAGDASNRFIIDRPGAYYLTAIVNVGAGMNGISIQADNVTRDLNGFGVVGNGGTVDAQRGITSRRTHSTARILNRRDLHVERMKYWEMIADKRTRDGWTCGVVSYFDGDGRKTICADAHRSYRAATSASRTSTANW